MSWVPKSKVKRPGFTLLEVTIAIVLIAMILVTSIVAFAGTVDSSLKLRTYGQNVFLNQEVMEERITEVKQNGGGDVAYETLFGKSVKGYLISEQMEGTTKYLKTFVIEDTAPELRLPNVDLVINRGNPYAYRGERVGPMDYTISGQTDDLSLWYTEWFVANASMKVGEVQKDFSIPTMFNYADGATTTEDLYPTYPNHFSRTRLVNSEITVSDDFLGRHLVYLVQPVGHYGILGVGNQSTYLYVMGVPVTSGLKHHFDMNFLSKADGSNLGLGEDVNVTTVDDMYNEGSLTRPKKITITTEGSGSIRSVSKRLLSLEEGTRERNQKFLRLKNAYADLSKADQVTVSVNLYHETGSQGLLFTRDVTTGGGWWWQQPVTTKSWEVKITDEGRVQMWLYGDSSLQLVYESEPLEEEQMHNISFTVASGKGNHQLRVDGEEVEAVREDFDARIQSSGNAIRLGGSGDRQLTEMVLYNRVLTENEFDSLEQYMLDKFQ